MDYIPEPSEFDAPDAPNEDLPCSPGPHVESTNSPSNTQSTPSQTTGETSSSKGSKRKAPMVDVIENQFSMLNNNLAVFGSYMKHGDEVATDLVEIARIQATATKDVAVDIRRCTDYYGEHVHHQRRITSYQYSESDIWSLLVDMNISDENLLDNAILCENLAKVKQLFGLHAQRRMTKLFNMMTQRN